MHVIRIRQDLVIEVSRKVLEEIDGPMLRHGLQEMQGRPLVVPSRTELKPPTTFLEERYELFRQAS